MSNKGNSGWSIKDFIDAEAGRNYEYEWHLIKTKLTEHLDAVRKELELLSEEDRALAYSFNRLSTVHILMSWGYDEYYAGQYARRYRDALLLPPDPKETPDTPGIAPGSSELYNSAYDTGLARASSSGWFYSDGNDVVDCPWSFYCTHGKTPRDGGAE